MSLDFQIQKFNYVLSVNGKLLEVPLRRGRADSAFIDYITFTVSKSTFRDRLAASNVVFMTEPDDEVYIHYISEVLQEIFGFGIGEKRQGKGKFFYNAYYQLGSSEVNYGTFHIGGQRGTVLIDLSGVGCQAALNGWEQRLYQFALTAERFQISRLDAAIDFFQGEFNTLKALSYYKKGLFDVRGMRPKYKLEGTDWFNNDGTGKTLYIGRRGSSKFCRVYEKGKQLGDVNSDWVRFEIEFRKNDCQIPIDMLINTGQYLAGAYKVGEKFMNAVSKRIESTNLKAETTLNQKIFHGRNQVGKLVRYLFDLGWDYERIVKSLIAEAGKYPSGLKPLEYDCTAKQVTYQHHGLIEEKAGCSQQSEMDWLCEKIQQTRLSSSALQEFNEEVEHWQFQYNQSKSDNPIISRVAEIEARQLIDKLFSKYAKYLA